MDCIKCDGTTTSRILVYSCKAGYIEVMGFACEKCGAPQMTSKNMEEFRLEAQKHLEGDSEEFHFLGSKEY